MGIKVKYRTTLGRLPNLLQCSYQALAYFICKRNTLRNPDNRRGVEWTWLPLHYHTEYINGFNETGRANIEYIDTPMIFLSDWALSDATQNTYNLSFTKPNHPNRAAWSDSSDRDIHVVNLMLSMCLYVSQQFE